MGKKQTWKRKYLLLYFACLMAILIEMQGCSRFRIWQGKQKLTGATSLMVKGNHKKALEYNKEVLRLFPQMFGDQALFQMGLNYSHPENPDSNYQKSIEAFQSIIVEYPKSNLRDDATIWVLLLRKIEEKNKMIKTLEGHNIKLEDHIIMLEDKNMQQKDLNRKLTDRNIWLGEQNVMLEDQIKKLKEIDLGIEEKKRKTLPGELGENGNE